MKRSLILVILFLNSINVFALEIKLQCNITARFYSQGKDENHRGVAIVRVKDDGIDKLIEIKSSIDIANNTTVSTFTNLDLLIQDLSNSNKWEIINAHKVEGGGVSVDKIIIDRNNGQLIATSVLTKNSKQATTGISSECEKIDEAIRRF